MAESRQAKDLRLPKGTSEDAAQGRHHFNKYYYYHIYRLAAAAGATNAPLRPSRTSRPSILSPRMPASPMPWHSRLGVEELITRTGCFLRNIPPTPGSPCAQLPRLQSAKMTFTVPFLGAYASHLAAISPDRHARSTEYIGCRGPAAF